MENCILNTTIEMRASSRTAVFQTVRSCVVGFEWDHVTSWLVAIFSNTILLFHNTD